MKKSLFILYLLVCFACASDDDRSNCNNIDLQGEEVVVAFFEAGFAFVADPNSDTCAAYESAGYSYIDYSQSILDCLDSEEKAELEQEIETLEIELSELSCT